MHLWCSCRFASVVRAVLCVGTIVVMLGVIAPAHAVDSCPYGCGDFNGDGYIDLTDFDEFAMCMGQSPEGSQECFCADMDGSGAIDIRDFALFSTVFALASDELPPDCSGVASVTADLTAYRPQHGAGYSPFARSAVAEADEEDVAYGPGIRINSPGDADPDGEDDLIEVEISVSVAGAPLILERSDDVLRVWTMRDKQSGTEIEFVGDRSRMLPISPGDTSLTLWVEWDAAEQGTAELHVELPNASEPLDTLVFHTFNSIVVALGGEDQEPSDPSDTNNGTFVLAIDLYHAGYDVHMYDEDDVEADGTGIVFDEIANAILYRDVTAVAVFGYSHGGGSIYNLADLLDISRANLGTFEISFTAYVDAVSNASDIAIGQELRRPPSTVYHLNQYQHGSFFEDLGLDGGPVTDSNPPPTGLDVETTAWGADCTHFEVDDFAQVRGLIADSLAQTVDVRFAGLQGEDRYWRGQDERRSTAVRDDGFDAELQPDSHCQAAIAAVVAVANEREQLDALSQLRPAAGDSDSELVRQLVYFSHNAGSMREAMAAGAVLQRLGLAGATVVDALVPLLESPDAALVEYVGNVLGQFEGRAAGRRPNFSIYREILAENIRTGARLPAGLVTHMYAVHPGEALLMLMRAHQVRMPERIQTIVWAEHAVSEMLWKQRNGFLARGEADAVTVAELTRLAGDDQWWVRLYVAATMRKHEALRTDAVVEQLQGDADPLVRETIAELHSVP